MKTQKIIMIVALTTFSLQVFAQTFGIKAGMNLSKIVGGDMEDIEMQLLIGSNMGVTAEFAVTDMFAIETGVFFSGKGIKVKQEMDFSPITIWEGDAMPDEADKISVTIKSKANPSYIELPINGKYYFNIGVGKLYLSAGAYCAIGVAGKAKQDAVVKGDIPEKMKKEFEKFKSEIKMDEKLKWGKGDGNIKRMDLGLNFGTGIEFGAIGISAQYGVGLTNTIEEDDEKLTHRVISISVSYKFMK